MTRYQTAWDSICLLMTALPARAAYGKWAWEAAKLVGAASASTIIGMQIAIRQHAFEMEEMRKDIVELRATFAHHAEKREMENIATRQKLEEIKELIHNHEVSTLSDELLRLRREQEARSMRQP